MTTKESVEPPQGDPPKAWFERVWETLDYRSTDHDGSQRWLTLAQNETNIWELYGLLECAFDNYRHKNHDVINVVMVMADERLLDTYRRGMPGAEPDAWPPRMIQERAVEVLFTQFLGRNPEAQVTGGRVPVPGPWIHSVANEEVQQRCGPEACQQLYGRMLDLLLDIIRRHLAMNAARKKVLEHFLTDSLSRGIADDDNRGTQESMIFGGIVNAVMPQLARLALKLDREHELWQWKSTYDEPAVFASDRRNAIRGALEQIAREPQYGETSRPSLSKVLRERSSRDRANYRAARSLTLHLLESGDAELYFPEKES